MIQQNLQSFQVATHLLYFEVRDSKFLVQDSKLCLIYYMLSLHKEYKVGVLSKTITLNFSIREHFLNYQQEDFLYI